ncbi:MAG TPA: nuclear transport factor 2 family protein [Gammaproteobacteria bacterium]
MMKKTLLAAVTVFAFAGAAAPASADDTDALREARDRAAIQELMWRYVRALDTLDADAYAAVFTEDGQFGSGRNAEKGRDALRGMIENLAKARAERVAKGEPPSPPMYHVITNSHIEFLDADHARYHAYWMTVFGASGEGTAPRVAAAGRSVDELVRVDGRWLIRSRDVAPQD